MPVVDDLRALVEQLVDHAADGGLVAGDGRGGDDDPVARVHLDLLMLGKGHAVQGGHGLALAAGGDDDHLVARQLVELLDIHHHVVRDIHIAQHLGHAQDVLHAAPGDADLAAVLHRHVDDLLQAVDVGGEGGDDDALVAALEELVEARADLALGVGVAGLFHIGGVAHQRENALVAQLAQAHQIHHAAGDRRHVDLEVAGVDDGADGRGDGQGHRVGDRVVHMDKLHREVAQPEHGARPSW